MGKARKPATKSPTAKAKPARRPKKAERPKKAGNPKASGIAKAAPQRSTPRPQNSSEFYQVRRRKPFSVFLIVDDAPGRSALAGVLKSQSLDVHEYMTAMEFYRDYRTPVPGVLIAEVRLRGLSGIELFEKLTAEKCELPVVLIAGHADAPTAIRTVSAGAFDFLTKPITEDSLLAVVASAYCCYYDVDADVLMVDPDDVELGLKRLTGREREVLDSVVGGKSSREISQDLGISTKTVEAHRARINDKMRSDDLAHLVRMVLAVTGDKN